MARGKNHAKYNEFHRFNKKREVNNCNTKPLYNHKDL